jgi:hypothetical protein
LVERGFLHSFLDALLVRLAVLLPSSSALICFVWNCATTRILQRRLHIARITRNTIVHGNAVVGCFIIIIMLFPANNLPPAHPAALSLRNGEYFVNAPRDIFPRSSRPALAQWYFHICWIYETIHFVSRAATECVISYFQRIYRTLVFRKRPVS